MELKIDLLKKPKKSILIIVLGILIIVISIVLLYDRMAKNRIISIFDWIFFACTTLSGALNTIMGFGFNLDAIFGKAFVLIDDEIISIKKGVFDKEQSIVWNDIKSIEYKFTSVEILKLNGTLMSLNLKGLEYLVIKEIKQVMNAIADGKGIMIN